MARVGQRTPVKEIRILNELRRQIVEGRFPPGSQLPKRDELERQFRVSPITLQKALSGLIHDGFVYAKTGKGTFVVDEPPHLSRYGLVFPSDPGSDSWNNFFAAMNNEAMAIQRARPERLSMYFGLENPARHESRDKLIADVQAHRVAGLIFASPPFNFVGTPLLDEPGMARVTASPFKDLPAVVLDNGSLLERALNYLAARGRRRIALLSGHVSESLFIESFSKMLPDRQMETRTYWEQAVHPNCPQWSRNVVELMFHGGSQDRPDGLIITDDNLVPHATAGLLAAGIRVPDEVDVVAHCNFPWPTPSMVFAKRIGFDARQVLGAFVASIDMQRRGETPPPVTEIVAVMDDEVD